MGDWSRRADREDSVRQTVYVSDIDQHVFFWKHQHVFLRMSYRVWLNLVFFLSVDPLGLQVTEQKLAEDFSICGQVCYKVPDIQSG